MGLAILDLLFIIFCLVRRQRVATHSAHWTSTAVGIDSASVHLGLAPVAAQCCWITRRACDAHLPCVGLSFEPRALRSYCQSEPWYSVSGPGYDLGYGVVDTVSRLPSGNAFRKAGDAAFPFAFFAFLAQIYVTFAVTLRFLGRNDGCSGRLPHSLKV